MSVRMAFLKRLSLGVLPLAVMLIALLAHGILLSPAPLWLQSMAVFLLTGGLPAALLLAFLMPPLERTAMGVGEHLLYIIGTGYGICVTVMLLLSYLPGPIAGWMAWGTFDLLLVVGSVLFWLHHNSTTYHSAPPSLAASTFVARRGWLWAGLVVLAVVGGLLRFPGLGYAEFQGDEARAMLRAAEVISGFDGSLFEHRKGPTEILLPAAPYVFLGRIDEAAARLPFAFANFCALFGLFLLGWRWFGPLAGWVAAILLALDGYLIAFSRIVQYQSIIFLTVVLVLLLLQRLVLMAKALQTNDNESESAAPRIYAVPNENRSFWQGRDASAHHNRAITSHFALASFLLATGLLSHYEAILVLIPAALLLWQLWRNGVGLWRLLLSFIPAIVIGGLLLSLFYIPFVRYPTFGNTFEYLAYKRIGEEFAYNNLADYFIRSTLYSSTYAFGLMTLLAMVGLMLRFYRGLGRFGLFLSGVLLGGLTLSFVSSHWLTIAGMDFTWLFFVLMFVVGILMPERVVANRVAGERTVWLWFGAVMVLSIFFTATPNTHVYNFYFGWALVCGVAVAALWYAIVTRQSAGHLDLRELGEAVGQEEHASLSTNTNLTPPMGTMYGAATLAVTLIMLFSYYQYSLFIRNDVEVLRTWPEHRPPGYWTAYKMPVESSIFGFPHRNSWKSVAVLMDRGVIDGAFDTNTKDWIVDWYTRGQGSCPRDHRYFVLADMVEPAKAEERMALKAELEQAYELLGIVDVQGQERLHIYKKQPTSGILGLAEVEHFDGAADAAYFDHNLAGPQLTQSGRVAQPTMARTLDFQVGDAIRFRGYTLEGQQAQPGGEVKLTLYWEVSAPLAERYTVFAQLINREDARKAGQRDGEPVCGKLPTTDWRPGDLIADPYYIPVEPNTPFGTYSVLIGMYPTDPNSSTGNLTFYNAEGVPLGEALSIDEIYVEPANDEQTAKLLR